MFGPDVYSPKISLLTKEKMGGWGMHIPDKSIVTSQIFLRSQRVRIDYSELERYFREAPIVTNNPLDIVKKEAEYTMHNLRSGPAKWEEIVRSGKDKEYSLGQVVAAGSASCFHRSIFFQLLMQQTGIACTTVEGMWFEKENAEAHVWNLVQLNSETYLVDTAYHMEKDGEKVPVIQRIDGYTGGQEYFAVPLPSGDTRQYVASGKIKVAA